MPETPPSGRIRRATLDDAAASAEVLLVARQAALEAGTIPQGIHDDADVRRWVREVVLPVREVWVAEVGGDVVGVMVMHDDWVDLLYLMPGATGQGLGSRLLDLAKAECPGGLQLWTFESNAGAQRFYERHGFVATERTDGAQNEERSPDIRYVWRAAKNC